MDEVTRRVEEDDEAYFFWLMNRRHPRRAKTEQRTTRTERDSNGSKH